MNIYSLNYPKQQSSMKIFLHIYIQYLGENKGYKCDVPIKRKLSSSCRQWFWKILGGSMFDFVKLIGSLKFWLLSISNFKFHTKNIDQSCSPNGNVQ